jgi:spermidine synthase
MGLRFEELDRHGTPIGEISLRRRTEPTLGAEVYEVKLGDEYLMSSLFTVAEIQLARLGLHQVAGNGLDVLIGGLGLGYTARAALDDPRVRSLTVVERLEPVIEWHRRRLLPDTAGLATDPRTRLVHGDFFDLVRADAAVSEDLPRAYDAILLDIDHTPHHVLDPSHGAFYSRAGLAAMKGHLRSGGAFALWSDDPPDEPFMTVLSAVFAHVAAEVVTFANPLTRGESSNTVYVARG